MAYALAGLQDGPRCSSRPVTDIYEGMIVGENSRENDLTVNPAKEKKLTNIRAAGSDENILLKPPRMMSLEMALEYIEDDELVEVTPRQIRLRKMLLRESDRRRQARTTEAGRSATILDEFIEGVRRCLVGDLPSRSALARLSPGAAKIPEFVRDSPLVRDYLLSHAGRRDAVWSPCLRPAMGASMMSAQ